MQGCTATGRMPEMDGCTPPRTLLYLTITPGGAEGLGPICALRSSGDEAEARAHSKGGRLAAGQQQWREGGGREAAVGAECSRQEATGRPAALPTVSGTPPHLDSARGCGKQGEQQEGAGPPGP